MAENEDLQTITFERDREKFWSELASQVAAASEHSGEVLVTAITHDHHAFQLTLIDVSGQILTLQLANPTNREIKLGEEIQLAFGLDDGQFFIRSYIQDKENGLIRVPFRLDTELLLLQRRASLRVSLTAESRVVFDLASFGSKPLNPLISVRPLNLSAGGLRLQWPLIELGEPKLGEALSGFLKTHARRLETFGVVQSVYPDGHTVQVGVAFQNLSTRDEQALLFLCLELRRKELNALK